jgi:glucose/arabinose dehydrogenase
MAANGEACSLIIAMRMGLGIWKTSVQPCRRRSGKWRAERIGAPRSECAQAERSVQTTQAHAAPMAKHFAAARGFPAPCRDDAYTVMHGSWNRTDLAAYKTIRFNASGGP